MADAQRWQRACPACGAADAVPAHENRMAPLDGRDLSYRVASCHACGLAYADRLAAPEAYDAYYRELSKYDRFDDAKAIPAAARVRADAALALAAPRLAAGTLVADLGCGPGVLLDAFARGGWRVAGLDPAPHAPAQARALFGLEGVQSGALRDAPRLLDLRNAALVCMTGVLEHLPRPREELAPVLAALPAGAKLLVEVPALERFMARAFEPFGEFSLEHLQYFSAATLERFFAGLGYRPLALELLPLPEGTTDSLLGLFERAAGAPGAAHGPGIADYVQRSAAAFDAALARLDTDAQKRVIVYGAGSHSARLLPALLARGWGSRLARLVDANPNLQGKALGPLRIEPPEALLEEPGTPVLVSSFRSQEAIAGALARRFPNPLVRLYAAPGGVRLG